MAILKTPRHGRIFYGLSLASWALIGSILFLALLDTPSLFVEGDTFSDTVFAGIYTAFLAVAMGWVIYGIVRCWNGYKDVYHFELANENVTELGNE